LGQLTGREKICNYHSLLNITPGFYSKFVLENIDYQRKLAKIKALVLDQSSTA
jgi:hypothetical protein